MTSRNNVTSLTSTCHQAVLLPYSIQNCLGGSSFSNHTLETRSVKHNQRQKKGYKGMKKNTAVFTQEKLQEEHKATPRHSHQTSTQHIYDSPSCDAYHDAHKEDGDDWKNYD